MVLAATLVLGGSAIAADSDEKQDKSSLDSQESIANSDDVEKVDEALVENEQEESVETSIEHEDTLEPLAEGKEKIKSNADVALPQDI